MSRFVETPCPPLQPRVELPVPPAPRPFLRFCPLRRVIPNVSIGATMTRLAGVTDARTFDLDQEGNFFRGCLLTRCREMLCFQLCFMPHVDVIADERLERQALFLFHVDKITTKDLDVSAVLRVHHFSSAVISVISEQKQSSLVRSRHFTVV